MLSLLKGYKRPNDKLHELLAKGILLSIKRGLYIAGPLVKSLKPEPFLIANHILGPSYISADSALSYHGFIPERVYEIISMTTKASRRFETQAGLFAYIHLPLPYYSFGIKTLKLADDQFAMIASAEKALFDKIITTRGLVLRSKKDAENYLLNGLRIDKHALKELNCQEMLEWIPCSPKNGSLNMIMKMLEHL